MGMTAHLNTKLLTLQICLARTFDPSDLLPLLDAACRDEMSSRESSMSMIL